MIFKEVCISPVIRVEESGWDWWNGCDQKKKMERDGLASVSCFGMAHRVRTPFSFERSVTRLVSLENK